MTPTTSARAAWALPAVALVILVGAVVADLRASPTTGTLLAPEPSWVFALTGLVHATVAGAVLRRRGVSRMAVLVAGLGAFWMFSAVVHSLVRVPAIGSGLADGAQGWELALMWVAKLTSSPLATGSNFMLAVFPSGRFLAGRWGWVGRLNLGFLVGVTFLLALTPIPFTMSVDPAQVTDHPAIRPTVVPVLADHLPSLGLLIVLAYCAAVVNGLTVVVRYRRSSGAERDMLRWLVWGVVTLTFLIAGFRLVLEPGQLTTLGITAAVNTIALSLGLGLLNPSWVSIEDLLSRTLVYGGLSIAIIVIDLTVLAGLTTVLGARLDDEQVVLLVLLLSAVLYNPLRSSLWTFVRRLVLGERDDRYDVVAGLASSLEAADESTEQLAAVAQAVGMAFGIGFVSVELERDGEGPSVASYGVRPAEIRELPISYRGEVVGTLVLPLRGIRTRLSDRDQQLLGDLVRQAATAARTGRLADELQQNRQRIVVAREEERRRIRHDLHEDLGPTLGGLVNQVETARLLVLDRPAEAKATIARTSAHLREVVADVRRVVHDLRPPVLDDRGLVGALRQRAELGTTETLEITVAGSPLDGLPAAVEVAAYRILAEALDDVRSDRSATRCAITIRREDRSLEAAVATDARLDPVPLAVRAAELGGRVAGSGEGLVLRLPIREHLA